MNFYIFSHWGRCAEGLGAPDPGGWHVTIDAPALPSNCCQVCFLEDCYERFPPCSSVRNNGICCWGPPFPIGLVVTSLPAAFQSYRYNVKLAYGSENDTVAVASDSLTIPYSVGTQLGYLILTGLDFGVSLSQQSQSSPASYGILVSGLTTTAGLKGVEGS